MESAIAFLQSKGEIADARRELERRDLSCLTNPWIRRFRDRGLLPGVSVGHYLKSWDVLRTATFIEATIPRVESILDLGAHASEILCVLHRLGYSNLSGVDLDRRVRAMPYRGKIKYNVGDFLSVPAISSAFAAVTAISVIEHGFDSERLLERVTNLLRPGGYFVASFDYWPHKIDTSQTQMFGMDWKIFSETELQSFLRAARIAGLQSESATPAPVVEPVIDWNGKQYTFAWIALRKRPQ